MNYLLRQIRHMKKSALSVRMMQCAVLQDPIQQMVADIGARCAGKFRGHSGLPDRFGNLLDRNAGKIGGRAVFRNRPVDGLIAAVVRYRGIVQIDGDPLYRNGAASSPNTVGTWRRATCAPSHSSGIRLTASHAGFREAPPKGSNAVTRIFINSRFFPNHNRYRRTVGPVEKFQFQYSIDLAVNGLKVFHQRVLFLKAAVAAVINAQTHDAARL